MRRSLALAGTVVALFAIPTPALAGGNWLDFRQDPRAGSVAGADGGGNLGTWAVVHVGQAVIAHTGIYVPNDRTLERFRERTSYAWLTADSGDLFEGGLPADAIRLAPFVVDPSGDGATVRARFTVPAVPSGAYEVVICDDPCTEPGFDQYVQGWITIRQTPAEARLFALARDQEWRLRASQQRARKLERQLAELEVELDRARAGLVATERLEAARLAELRAAVLRAADRPIADPAHATWPLVLAWAIALASLAVTAAVVARRPARRFRIAVPDTVPDELDRLERVAGRS